MTKTDFIQEYERRIVEAYPWANDAAKLARFMDSVRTTLTTDRAAWNYDGPTTTAAWHAIGGKGKPTRKALRALP